ncbi:uncharacterized protein EI90DRAFT_1820588 [Cantharellus anzutake]|uniref:uncharacterized protein n=1 Tax=Cantharellus anzutake TaxID=1750568 RepID=UPI0019063F74|nr:uncharacterized protein EI90DRAFT_1820588 [Cantharellus anzutake]KAF8327153.1 hypothetical protein EI90DRAFT_1820588 [Cantharellus anzutake]
MGGWRRPDSPMTHELMAIRRYALKTKLVKGLNWLKKQVSSLPPAIAQEVLAIYVMCANHWLNMPEGKRTCYGITAINSLVFIAWQIPRLRPFMVRHFSHHPLSGKSYTLFTSMFSHQNAIHFLFNSIALLSFGAAFEVADSQRPGVLHQPHDTDRYHFLAFYVCAGLFSGALSHIVATRVRLPRLLSALSDATKAKSMDPSKSTIRPSLGASGAIYGAVAMTAMAMPETHVTLIFFPWLPIPSQVGFAGAVALDIVGIIRGWRVFDHWAHLGGALTGMAYFFYAPWEKIRFMLWRTFRS